MGLPASSTPPIAKDIELPSWPRLPAADEITKGIEERRLDLLALRKGYESQEASLRAAIRAQFPKINVGATHARDTTNVVTTGYGVTIDLPVFDRNQGHIAVERATRRQLYDEYASRVFESRAEIARILSDMESVKRRIAASEDSLPKLDQLATACEKALHFHDADILTCVEARNNVTSRRMEILSFERDLADLGVALEIAAGRYFPSEPAPIRKAGG
jgi:outer membrane protein TolC